MKKPNKPTSDLCRVCGKEIPKTKESSGPFCSERCRLNDLSKWFGENYRVPSSPASGEFDEKGDEFDS